MAETMNHVSDSVFDDRILAFPSEIELRKPKNTRFRAVCGSPKEGGRRRSCLNTRTLKPD